MKIEKLWCVTDPTKDSTLADVCFETTLAGIERQFEGGLTMAANPTLFTERAEAEADAHLRLVAIGAMVAISAATPSGVMGAARRVVVIDKHGNSVINAILPSAR